MKRILITALLASVMLLASCSRGNAPQGSSGASAQESVSTSAEEEQTTAPAEEVSGKKEQLNTVSGYFAKGDIAAGLEAQQAYIAALQTPETAAAPESLPEGVSPISREEYIELFGCDPEDAEESTEAEEPISFTGLMQQYSEFRQIGEKESEDLAEYRFSGQGPDLCAWVQNKMESRDPEAFRFEGTDALTAAIREDLEKGTFPMCSREFTVVLRFADGVWTPDLDENASSALTGGLPEALSYIYAKYDEYESEAVAAQQQQDAEAAAQGSSSADGR